MKVSLKMIGLLEINFQTDKFSKMKKNKNFKKILLVVLFTSFCVIGHAQVDDCISKMETRILQLAIAKSNDDFVKRSAEARILLNKLGTCPCFERNSNSLEKEKKRLEKMFNENFSGYVTNFKMDLGVYTGSLKSGKREGKGKLIYTFYSKYYDGDWKNGNEDGKGTKEYNDGTIYNGEFKDGYKEGKGKEKNKNGEYYDGNWKAGYKIGYGRAKIIYNDSLSYEGGVYKGYSKHGWGREIFKNKYEYNGEWKNDASEGFGNITYKSGNSYEGEWKLNKWDGFGYYKGSNLINCPKAFYYFGYWKANYKQGFGRCYDNELRLIYEGEFLKDIPNTPYPNFFPIEESLNSESKKYNLGNYIGQINKSNREGYGTMKYNSGSKYYGEWKNDFHHGFGTLINYDSTKYIGEWKIDVKSGWGIETWNKGLIYNGEWRFNMKNGYGVYDIGKNYSYIEGFINATTYRGNWKDNKFEGFGRLYDKDKYLLHEGEFKEGKAVDRFPNRQ
jgi:hypothetical protein